MVRELQAMTKRLLIVLFPLVVVGGLAWLVYVGLAMGWNIVDEYIQQTLDEEDKQ
jgi:hypothetical protein